MILSSLPIIEKLKIAIIDCSRQVSSYLSFHCVPIIYPFSYYLITLTLALLKLASNNAHV